MSAGQGNSAAGPQRRIELRNNNGKGRAMSVSSVLGRGGLAAALLLIAGAAFAQAPAQEAPKNLKVLPKDWSRPQVIAVMQNFTAALGVGCDYCHVQQQGTPPDFASDDKKE